MSLTPGVFSWNVINLNFNNKLIFEYNLCKKHAGRV